MCKGLLKKTVVIFFILFLVFALSGFAQAQTSIEDTRNSVVRVIVFEAGTDRYLGAGTGFVVGDSEPFEYVATAAHVVEGDVDVYIWRSRDDTIQATVHVMLSEADVALLKLDPQHLLYGYDPMELARRDMVQIGDPVYAVGFPAAADWSLSDFTAAYPEDSTVTAGIISKFTTFMGAAFYQMDATVSWGNSGGPLVNQNGQVIGIVSRGAVLEGIFGAVQIEYLTDILRSRGIPFKLASEVTTTIPAQPVDEDQSAGVVETEDTAIGEQTGTANILQDNLIIILIAAALLLVIAAVILSRSKKTPAATVPQSFSQSTQQINAAAGPVTRTRPESAPAVTQAKRKQARPIIKGISGQFAGQNLELVDNQLTIGRDPRLSQLVYPNNKEEISRKHCTIRYDDTTNKFTLVDSSSNGTYLSSNQKLEPGETYYLNSGDRFYLADSSEVFEVKVEA